MIPLLRTLGSVAFAVFLISLLAILLIVSTSLESLYGTPFVQKFFYQTGWFDLLLALFAVNIFCATLPRFPFKKRHTGFIITHIGLLCLLFGALLSRFMGVDGQMALFEGETRGEITQSTYQ